MKRIHLSSFLLALVLVSLVGCAGLYQGAVTMTTVVDNAMTQWGSMSKRGLTSEAVDQRVIAAHDRYRAACGTAARALRAYKESGDQQAYLRALETARIAAEGILDLITPLLSPKEAERLNNQMEKASGI